MILLVYISLQIHTLSTALLLWVSLQSKKKDPPHFCGRSPYSQLGSGACTNYFAMYLAET